MKELKEQALFPVSDEERKLAVIVDDNTFIYASNYGDIKVKTVVEKNYVDDVYETISVGDKTFRRKRLVYCAFNGLPIDAPILVTRIDKTAGYGIDNLKEYVKPVPVKTRKRTTHKRYDANTKALVRKMYSEGVSFASIGRILDIPQATVYHICKNEG